MDAKTPSTPPGSGATPTTPQGTRTSDPFDKRKEKKPETFCLFCGMPMTRQEQGLTAADPRASEWDEHTFANVEIHGCIPCWNERKAWIKDGIRGADERKKALEDLRAKSLGTDNC